MERALFVLAALFIPFIWFIYRMIRYTDDTIGENSPLYRERTYEILWEHYFVTVNKILFVIIVTIMFLVSKILVLEAIRLHNPLISLLALFFFGFAIYILFVFYVDWQYWTITRDVQLTLNPFDPSIHVESPDQIATITPENVTQIESHLRKSDNAKEPLYGYGYLLFYLTDGTIVRINNLFFSHYGEFLERFFQDTPKTTIYHRIPWISSIE